VEDLIVVASKGIDIDAPVSLMANRWTPPVVKPRLLVLIRNRPVSVSLSNVYEGSDAEPSDALMRPTSKLPDTEAEL